MLNQTLIYLNIHNAFMHLYKYIIKPIVFIYLLTY